MHFMSKAFSRICFGIWFFLLRPAAEPYSARKSCSRSCASCRRRDRPRSSLRRLAAGRQMQALLHNRTLLPRHPRLPANGKGVTHVSGTICHLCLGPLTCLKARMPSGETVNRAEPLSAPLAARLCRARFDWDGCLIPPMCRSKVTGRKPRSLAATKSSGLNGSNPVVNGD
jgi:hypothetical protein